MDLLSFAVSLISIAALIYAGGMRMLFPENSLAMLQLKLGSTINSTGLKDLKNEIRSVGMVMLLAALILVVSLVTPEVQVVARTIASCLFLGTVFGRLLGAFVDGKPSPAVLKAAFVETILAIANGLLLLQTIMA